MLVEPPEGPSSPSDRRLHERNLAHEAVRCGSDNLKLTTPLAFSLLAEVLRRKLSFLLQRHLPVLGCRQRHLAPVQFFFALPPRPCAVEFSC